ncbi:hypothetical protein LPJ66_003848 [Kickxella alabastrina]|uniref:Uncharacterized protein n=1 Tax=Kickxella alabastrina TaxID=61397 RepID=A0ACC1IMF4_9FUNG|nr:hypothetical protein LPJ66_003848 [Kickxella alabastrina]
MTRRVSNFDNDIFSQNTGFQSIHSRTLPGRTTDYTPWCDSAWPRIHHHNGNPYHTFNNAPVLGHHHHSPFYQQRPPVHPVSSRPDIMHGFFEAPAASPAGVVVLGDRQIITLRSDVFRDVKPSVQVKGGSLRVFAARVQSGTSAGGWEKRDSEFEYTTALQGIYDVRRMSASRSGDTLTITIPKI